MSHRQAASIRSRVSAAWSALALAAIAVAIFALFRSSQVLSPAGKSWSPNVPVGFEHGPPLHSEPAIGAGGGEVVVAWVDSRDSVPDIYARGLKGSLPAADRRVSDPGPHFDAHDNTAPAIVVGPGGRAYAVYTDGDAVLLARYDVASGRWVSHTQVTPSGLPWYARPNAPDLASDGNDNLFVVWEDYRNADPSDSGNPGADIYVARCRGNAMTCADSAKVSADATPRTAQLRPRVVAHGMQMVVAWEDERDRGPAGPQVYARRSNDGGQTWQAEARVNADLAGSATRPSAAIDTGGTAWVAWEQHAAMPTDPPYIVSAQWAGSSWANHRRVDQPQPRSRAAEPDIAAGNAGVFAVWTDYRAGSQNPDVYSARWNGNAWIEIGVANQPGAQTRPAVAAASDDVFVTWQDARGGPQEVYAARWNGNGWNAGLLVHQVLARQANQMHPSLARNPSSGALYLTWIDLRSGYKDLWMSAFDGRAALPVWSPPQALPTQAASESNLNSQPPATVVEDSGRLHALWSEYWWPRGYHIYHSVYSGTQWSDPIWVTQPAVETDDRSREAPAAASRGNKLAAAWTLALGNSWPHSYTIQVAWFDGAAWSAPADVLTQPVPGSLPRPSIALDSAGNTYVAWTNFFNHGNRGDVFVAKYDTSARRWTNYRRVNSSPSSIDWCYHASPQIVVDSRDRLHVVWIGCVAWQASLFYSFSADGGANWLSPSVAVAAIDDAGAIPALSLGPNDELMALYPNGPPGEGRFYAARLSGGAWQPPILVSDGSTDWHASGNYDETGWYGGDSGGALMYDPTSDRSIAVFPDRRGQRGPRLYSAVWADLNLRRTFVPLIRR